MKKISRRSFLANSSFLSFAGLAGFLPFLHFKKNNKINKTKEKKMFVHHVLFWLKNPASTEDYNKLLEGLNTLKPIEVIRTVHIGKPASTDRPVIERSYQFSLLLVFDTLEDQNIYQDHPIHLKFVENYSSLWSKVVIYDSVDA